MRNRIAIAAFGVSLFTIFIYQNCSPVEFRKTQLESLATKCQPAEAPELGPKVKWDWFVELEHSPGDHYLSFNQVMSTPVVADLDGGNSPEVVFTTFSISSEDHYPESLYHPGEVAPSGAKTAHHQRNGVLRIVNGNDGRTKLSISGSDLAPKGDVSPLLMDIDGDGKVEIFYIHYLQDRLIALNNNGSLRWVYQLPEGLRSSNAGLTGSDLNRDGIGEILIGKFLVSENIKSRKPKLLATLDNNQLLHHLPSLALPLNPKEPGKYFIVTVSGVYDYQGAKIADVPSGHKYLAAADLYSEYQGLEIVATGPSKLTIFSGLTGEIIASSDLSQYNDLFCENNTVVGGGPPSVGDFDGDKGNLEIAVATGRHLTIFDREGLPKYKSITQDCSSKATGVTSFDLNGDKKPEVLYADEEYFKIFEIKDDGRLEVVQKIINPSATLYEYPVVADITGDKRAEILVASNNYYVKNLYREDDELGDKDLAATITGLRAFESTGQSAWLSTRRVWNQHSFHPDLVSDGARFISNGNYDGSHFRRNTQGAGLPDRCYKVKL